MVVDRPTTIGTLPVAVAQTCGPAVPIRRVRRHATSPTSAPSSAETDAYVIAEAGSHIRRWAGDRQQMPT